MSPLISSPLPPYISSFHRARRISGPQLVEAWNFDFSLKKELWFFFMNLICWMLQNAFYEFCHHSCKLLRIHSVCCPVVNGPAACTQVHSMWFLLLIFFPCQVSIFNLLPSLEVRKLSVLPTNTYCVAIFLSHQHCTNSNHTVLFALIIKGENILISCSFPFYFFRFLIFLHWDFCVCCLKDIKCNSFCCLHRRHVLPRSNSEKYFWSYFGSTFYFNIRLIHRLQKARGGDRKVNLALSLYIPNYVSSLLLSHSCCYAITNLINVQVFGSPFISPWWHLFSWVLVALIWHTGLLLGKS